MKKASTFGKYLLLDRLNVGGMAEVFIAKAFGVEGLERYIAIKKILPSMAEDEEFIRMFIDEARISVQLNHANIVHIHELEKVGESYYIAMEYVAGKDVRTLLERYRKRGEAMPVPQAVFIVSKMCEGLHYAHTRKDARGQELGIIHRDVSPQNILVSYEGEVKIIDFGIAKAANRSQKTQAGILKGKFGYMSPEMVRGQPIDRRSDIFAVGVILYELLTGEKLFTGESDYSILEKVRNAQVPTPREFNPGIPAGLEKVLMKALAREPADRYQWAADLQEDLIRFLLIGDQIFTSKHLADFMKSAFAEEIARENAAMEQYATVERPESLSPEAPARKTPVPVAPAEFGADEDEENGKTQLIDQALVDSLDLGGGAEEENPEATRFDAVNPFGHEVAPPADRAPRVVIGANQAYAGETVVGAPPTRAEVPVVGNDATRLIQGAGAVEEEADDQTNPYRTVDRYRGQPEGDEEGEAEQFQEGEGEYGEGEYGDGEYAEEPQEEGEGGALEADGEQWPEGEDDADEVTGSVSKPGPVSPAPAKRPGFKLPQLPGPKWLPLAAIGGALVLVIAVVGLIAHSGHSGGQPLVVRVLDPAQVEITVDGQPVKNGVVTRVAPGAHQVEIRAPGYRTEHRSVGVVAGRMPPVVELALQPVAAKPLPIAVASPGTMAAGNSGASNPEGAPTTAGAASGGAQAPADGSAKAADQTSGSDAANPDAPAPAEAPAAAKTFTAQFDCEEDGVEISVDGKPVGKTPGVKLADLVVGKTYRFSAQRAGYKGDSGSFRSTDGSDVVVPVDLEKLQASHESHASKHASANVHVASSHHSARSKLGRLAASTHPAGAEIWVDNRATGRYTPVAPGSPLMLPVGRHQVVFKLGSKRSPVQHVVIDEKETTKLINVPLE